MSAVVVVVAKEHTMSKQAEFELVDLEVKELVVPQAQDCTFVMV
jgi:translation elongation factor EF-Tu-like GTPase